MYVYICMNLSLGIARRLIQWIHPLAARQSQWYALVDPGDVCDHDWAFETLE